MHPQGSILIRAGRVQTVLIKKCLHQWHCQLNASYIHESATCDTPANVVWVEINSDTLAWHPGTWNKSACTQHTPVRHQLHVKKTKQIWTEIRLLLIRCKFHKVRKTGKAGVLREPSWYYWHSDHLFCSLEPSLYLVLVAICWCKLSYSEM